MAPLNTRANKAFTLSSPSWSSDSRTSSSASSSNNQHYTILQTLQEHRRNLDQLERAERRRSAPVQNLSESVERRANTQSTISRRLSRECQPSVARTMGFKETEEYISKMQKENFDLKIQLYCRHEKWRKMVDEAERATILEKENIELKERYDDLMEMNDSLMLTMDMKDGQLLDAVDMIERYKKQVAHLEASLKDVKRIHRQCKERLVLEMPAITLSGAELALSTPYQLHTVDENSHELERIANFDHLLPEPTPHIAAEENKAAEHLRPNDPVNDQHLALFDRPTQWRSPSPCPSDRVELSAANLSLLLNSPPLSILSESSFISVYGRKNIPEDELISEFNFEDYEMMDPEPFRLPARALFGIEAEETDEHQYDSYSIGESAASGLRPSPRFEMQRTDHGASSTRPSSISTTNTGSGPQLWKSGLEALTRAPGALPASRIPVRISRPTTASDGSIESSMNSPSGCSSSLHTTPPGTKSYIGSSPPKWTSRFQEIKSKSEKVDAGTSPMSIYSQRKSSSALTRPNTPRPSTGKSVLFTQVTPKHGKTPRVPTTTIAAAAELPVSRIKVQSSSPPQELEVARSTTNRKVNNESKGRGALTRMGKAALNATRRTSSTIRSKISESSMDKENGKNNFIPEELTPPPRKAQRASMKRMSWRV